MSIFFFREGADVVEHEEIFHMSNGRALLFASTADAAGRRHSLSPGVSIADHCFVNEEQFCTLVEKVFSAPINILYYWALYAAAIYEIVKGERYDWYWNGEEGPGGVGKVEVVPRRQGYSPEGHSGKAIRPRYPLDDLGNLG
jgi:hypothetical protein